MAELSNGGGIYAGDGSVSVDSDAQVNGNNAGGGSGGGIYAASGNVTVAATGVVNSNFAEENGGGIFQGKGNASLAGKVNGNVTDFGSGGGLYVEAGDVSILSGGDIKGNQAHDYYNSSSTDRNGSLGGTRGFGSSLPSSFSNSAIRAAKPSLSGAFVGGGGIYVVQGNVTVSGGQINSNFAEGPGGGICALEGSVTLTDNAQVKFNTTTAKGAGIFDSDTASTLGVQITDATVSGNVSDRSSGAGVFVSEGSISVLDSAIFDNHAYGTFGGGLADFDSTAGVSVTNSTIGGNIANIGGGGIYSAGSAVINNSTIVLNALDYGFLGAGVSSVTSIDINNTIVAGNLSDSVGTPQDIMGTATGSNNVINNAASAGGLIDGQSDNIVGLDGTGTRPVNTIIDTTLANTGGPTETYSLIPGSVALGAGNSALNPASVGSFDQRGTGFPRMPGSMDIGAVEDSPLPAAIPLGTLLLDET
jgi:hypothetical protein